VTWNNQLILTQNWFLENCLFYYCITHTKKENLLKIVVFLEGKNRNCAFFILINTYEN
jgi:hypothetical protein